MTGRTDEKTGGSAPRSGSRGRHGLTRRYDRRMAWTDSLPGVLTAALGGTSVLTAVARGVQLSEPARLRKRLTATSTLLEAMPPGSSRRALELAVERESLRLAAMSLVQTHARRTSLITLSAFMIAALLVLVGLFGWVLLTTYDAAEATSADIKELQIYGPTVVIGYFLVLTLILASMIVLTALTTRMRREKLAAQLFADGSVDSTYVRHRAVDEKPRRNIAVSSDAKKVKPLRQRIATWLRGSGRRPGRATAPRDDQRD
jgi:hypothetical protein